MRSGVSRVSHASLNAQRQPVTAADVVLLRLSEFTQPGSTLTTE